MWHQLYRLSFCGGPEHRRCYGICREVQAWCVVKLPCPGTRQGGQSIGSVHKVECLVLLCLIMNHNLGIRVNEFDYFTQIISSIWTDTLHKMLHSTSLVTSLLRVSARLDYHQ